MKYDVIKTGEFTYRLVDKQTGKPVHIGDILNTEWEKRADEADAINRQNEKSRKA